MIVAILFIVVFVVLQTTVLSGLQLFGAQPDVAMIILIYIANRHGSLKGEVTAFGAGLLTDLLSGAPLGLFPAVYVPLAYLAGLTHNRVYTDPIIMPALFLLTAGLSKGLMLLLLGSVFGLQDAVTSVLAPGFLVELGMNVLLAPALFALMDMFGRITKGRRGSRGF